MIVIYFKTLLGFVAQSGFNDALHKFVDKDEEQSFGSFLQQQIKAAVRELSALEIDDTPDEGKNNRQLRELECRY